MFAFKSFHLLLGFATLVAFGNATDITSGQTKSAVHHTGSTKYNARKVTKSTWSSHRQPKTGFAEPSLNLKPQQQRAIEKALLQRRGRRLSRFSNTQCHERVWSNSGSKQVDKNSSYHQVNASSQTTDWSTKIFRADGHPITLCKLRGRNQKRVRTGDGSRYSQNQSLTSQIECTLKGSHLPPKLRMRSPLATV